MNRYLPKSGQPFSAIDLGGGAGGWVRYLAHHRPESFKPLALANSSMVVLTLAASVLPPNTQRYQIDLMQLQMREKWDAAFLLDVIGHLPDDLQALVQAREALKPVAISLSPLRHFYNSGATIMTWHITYSATAGLTFTGLHRIQG